MSQYRNVWIILLFCCFMAIYLIPGIYGHTPWKQDENYSFGIIQTMYETGNLLVPTNAGEPFMEKPPLYYWTATLTAHLLHGLLPLHDAARTASLFYSVINFCFFILLAKRVLQRSTLSDPQIWLAFALYISAPGILRHSHDMFTDVALMAGTTMALYGLVGLIIQQQRISSAIWLSLGTVITMLSKGVFIPGLIWITLLLSPLFFTACRTKQFWYPVLWAALGAAVLIIPWPIALYWQHPSLFIVWFWENNIGRFLGFSVGHLGARAHFSRIPEAIALFAFPSGLLACFYFLRHPLQRLRDTHEFALSLFAVLGIILLQISSSSRALYLLPFIAPMAILASRLFLTFTSGVSIFIRRFAAVLWSVVIALIWVLYLGKMFYPQHPWFEKIGRSLPSSYTLTLSLLPLLFALALTLLWLYRQKIIRTLNPPIQAALTWGIGITVAWGVIFTLLVGWIDYTKGYQGVFLDLKQQLAGQYLPSDCMASYEIDESEAPMLYYYTNIMHHRQHDFSKPEHCRWLIILAHNTVPEAPPGMALFWKASRPGETKNTLIVYKTIAP